MKRLILALVFLGFAASVSAQTPPVKNPSGLAFTSADHTLVTNYEVDIVRATDGTLVQTLTVSNAPVIPLVAGEVVLSLNVQPIAFGQYRMVARAVAGTIKSSNSTASDIWERAPGKPSGLNVR